MTVEVRPLGVACNLSCHYCYQNPQRDAGNQRMSYDLDKIKAAVKGYGKPFSLFGGEPLLVPFEDLEELFRWGFETFGKTSIQTNGVLIEERHIDLFRRYKVDVGISLDGPGALNDARWRQGLERTRIATAAVEASIEQLCNAQIPLGLIITLHRGNATADKLPQMCDWLRGLDLIGIRSARLHLLEVDDEGVRTSLALSPAENIAALTAFAELEPSLKSLRFDIYREIEDLLLGNDDKATCTWRACDPYTTPAVQGIEGNGDSSNCGRTNKAGISFIKSDHQGFERYLALQQTPQDRNGCGGCRFFLMCKGQCPGTAINGDWRNRTEHCAEWKHLFVEIERRLIIDGKTPLTVQPVRLVLEREMREQWLRGRNPSIASMLKAVHRSPNVQSAEGVKTSKGRGATQQARMSWVSTAARDLWRPRLSRLATLLEDGTLREASDNQCAVTLIPQRRFHEMLGRAKLQDQAAIILPLTALPGVLTPLPDNLGHGILLTGAAASVALARDAFKSGDTNRLLTTLNLPRCCAAATPGRNSGAIGADIPFHALLAPLGIAILPVSPCSPDCAEATAASARWLALVEAQGFSEEASWLRTCLSWAADWSELNGVLEIKTPVFRLCLYLGADLGARRIQRAGASVVNDAPAGLSFPHTRPTRKNRVRLLEKSL